MKTRGYFTIEYIPEDSDDPEIEPAVIEFDEFTFQEHRDVRREDDAEGNFVRFVPDRTIHYEIKGARTKVATP